MKQYWALLYMSLASLPARLGLVLTIVIGVGCACAWFAAYSASKFTGGSRNWGKPPWVTRLEIAARAYGNSTPGQVVLTARLASSSARLRMTNSPACLTSTRNSVASPNFADTVTVSTTSRRSGLSGVDPVCRSRLIHASIAYTFVLSMVRRPFVASVTPARLAAANGA